MSHKNDYSVIVFFEDTKPKKWEYVHTLFNFSRFLDVKHSNWKYFNVYDRRKGNFLKRFNNGEFIPAFIS